MAVEVIHVGTPPHVTVSGTSFFALSDDELTIVTGYRLIRDQGGGDMILEVRDEKITRWDCRPNVGNARFLNEVIERGKRLRD